MLRSRDRILTTHVGSLPRPEKLDDAVDRRAENERAYEAVLQHPELVAERIGRFVKRVGKENVMAGTDCGLGGRVHPQLAWAKLKVLAQGAEMVSRSLR